MIITIHNKIINMDLFESINYGKDKDGLTYYVKAVLVSSTENYSENIINFYNVENAAFLTKDMATAWSEHTRTFSVDKWLQNNSIADDEYIIS